MPIKKHKTHHRVHREKHKRSKKFLKVYAPYIPLLLMVGLSIFFASNGANLQSQDKNNQTVLSYATEISNQSLLNSTNERREGASVHKLKLNPQLSEAAQLKAQDMSSKDYWSHTSPSGKEPWSFIEKSGYKYQKAAENLAYGFATSESTVAGWMNSPEHKKNLLDDSLRDVGFGIINIPNYQNSGPQTLVVAIYASSAKINPQLASSQKQGTQTRAVLAEEQTKITYIQSVTGGKAPWINFVIGLIFGASIVYLLAKHLRSIRRVIVSSERFVITHPLLDISIVAFAVLAIVLSQTAGFIQ